MNCNGCRRRCGVDLHVRTLPLEVGLTEEAWRGVRECSAPAGSVGEPACPDIFLPTSGPI